MRAQEGGLRRLCSGFWCVEFSGSKIKKDVCSKGKARACECRLLRLGSCQVVTGKAGKPGWTWHEGWQHLRPRAEEVVTAKSNHSAL